MQPIISIIVPCYNQAKYLDEALQSVLDQEFTEWECLIINDGSTDDTEEIASYWTERDKRFKYFAKANGGVSDTRNYGIKKASGEFILPLDGDDRIGNKYISEAITIFRNSPETKIVYSNSLLFGAKNQEIVPPDFLYENLFIENQIPCSAIFRKSDFLKTEGYNTNMVEGLEDWDFWLSFLQKGDKVVKLNDFHFFYRIKDISRSTMIDHDKNERLLLQIFKNHIPLFLEYFNPMRDHIEADYYKKEVKTLQNSWEYKIGKVITYPFRLINKILKKLG